MVVVAAAAAAVVPVVAVVSVMMFFVDMTTLWAKWNIDVSECHTITKYNQK